MAARLDETDRRILGHLVRDGRASVQEVADGVGLRRPSVHARIRRLEEAGVIQAYHAHLDPAQAGRGMVAFVHLQVAHGAGKDCLAACSGVVAGLRDLPAVLEAHTSSGDDDLVVKVRVADLRELEDLVLRRISGLPEVRRVRTSVVLSTHFERPVAPPPPGKPTTKRRRSPGRSAASVVSS
jgi:DNA-binding Lrp family transcriptional regulator